MLDLSRTVMDEFLYDYVKPKCDKKSKTLLYWYRELRTFNFKRKPKKP